MIQLANSVTATFNTSGIAIARIGPTRPNQTWHVTRVSTMIGLGANKLEELRLYLNFESPTCYLDGTKRAYQDTSETNITIAPQETMVMVWSKGTPGTTVTAFIVGSIN